MKWGNKKKKGFEIKTKKKNPFNFFKKKKKYSSTSARLSYKNKASPSKLFGSIWGLLAKPNYFHWFLCSLSGIVAGLCLPNDLNSKFSFLQAVTIWFALVPFFIVVWTSKTYLQSVGKSFLTGFCLNAVGFSFLLGIHPLDWLGVPDNLSLVASVIGLLIASVQQSLYWSLFGLTIKLLQRILGLSQWSAVQCGIVWVILIERLANSVNLGGNPQTSLYLTQHNNIYFIQMAEIFGASLFSFLIVFCNIAIAHWIVYLLDINIFTKKERQLINVKPQQFINCFSMSAQAILFFLLCYGYGIWQINSNQSSASLAKPIQTLLLQSGLSISDTRITGNSFNASKEYLNQFKFTNPLGYPVLTVIPEGAIKQSKVDNLAQYLSAVNPLTGWIIGSYYSKSSGDGSTESFNSAVAYDAEVLWSGSNCSLTQQKPLHKRKQVYLKQALVPFGECIPFKKQLRKLLEIFDLEYLTQNEFKAASEAKTFEFTFGKLSPLICLEVFFSEIVHSQVRTGAEGLVLIGDIAWFHQNKKQISAQMIAAAKFRAIESRRSVAISINQGPLAFIDRYGKVTALRTDTSYLYSTLSLNKQLTTFSKYNR